MLLLCYKGYAKTVVPVIGDNVQIKAKVLDPKIGNNSMIGADAVVVKDVTGKYMMVMSYISDNSGTIGKSTSIK